MTAHPSPSGIPHVPACWKLKGPKVKSRPSKVSQTNPGRLPLLGGLGMFDFGILYGWTFSLLAAQSAAALQTQGPFESFTEHLRQAASAGQGAWSCQLPRRGLLLYKGWGAQVEVFASFDISSGESYACFPFRLSSREESTFRIHAVGSLAWAIL